MTQENNIRPRPLHLKAIALGKIIQKEMPFLNEAEAIVRALNLLAMKKPDDQTKSHD